jgi:hypothetical protein
VASPYSTHYPAELPYGKEANFMVSFLIVPTWSKEFATGFVRDLSDRNLKTLVALIQTSVGQTVDVKPESNLLESLKKYRVNP